jgi:protein phosphatase
MSLGRTAAATDAGRRRRGNEDSYVCEPPLFAVADGMGGAQAGEIASRIAATVLRDAGGESADGEHLVSLIQEANRRVYERSTADEAVSGMGTTVTVAIVAGTRIDIGHVGDSRAYRVRDGRLEQLTEDHSLVAELMRSGRLSPEEAEIHPQRSVITRALGTDPDVDVDAFSVDARPDDLYLLCSDGLTSMIDDGAILAAVERNRPDLDRAARALVDAANKAGGEDNITVVLFEIDDEAPGDETATMPVATAPDDEDTLSGLDPVPVLRAPVPADDTMVVRPAEVDRAPARAAARRKTRDRRISRAALVVASLALILVLAALVVWGLSRSYFVGATHDGHVAVYQGFPWDIGGPVRMYRIRYQSPLLAGQLSRAERRALFDHDLRSYDAALRSVRAYEAEGVP